MPATRPDRCNATTAPQLNPFYTTGTDFLFAPPEVPFNGSLVGPCFPLQYLPSSTRAVYTSPQGVWVFTVPTKMSWSGGFGVGDRPKVGGRGSASSRGGGSLTYIAGFEQELGGVFANADSWYLVLATALRPIGKGPNSAPIKGAAPVLSGEYWGAQAGLYVWCGEGRGWGGVGSEGVHSWKCVRVCL
jgi:hypothetical protein